MADLTLKRFDTYPPLAVTLSDASGPIDLTLASAVHMEMQNVAKTTLIASLAMTIASAPGGYCKRNWTAGGTNETSMADTWSTEWEILWQNGGVQTVPNDGQKSIAIIADLENT
jgi:hypothetical protein